MTHQIVNVVTAFLMGAILMALGFVLLTRTGGCDGRPGAATSTPAVAVAVPSPVIQDEEEIARIAREAARRERAQQDARWVAAMCSDPQTTYEQRQILACAGGR